MENSPAYDRLQDAKAAQEEEARELTIENVQETFAPQSLEEWWVAKARAEIEDMTAKTAEYGGGGRAHDLIGIGNDLAQAMGRTGSVVGDDEATELGIWFYLRGKMGRAMAALIDGRMPSDDTIHDILVYARMIQRTREVGGWPN